MTDSGKIGKRVNTFRNKLDMSVADLAERTGLSEKLIEDIENGTVSPALGLMMKISRALGQRVGTFMDDQVAKDPVISRASERVEGVALHKGEEKGQYKYHVLGDGKTDRHMEPFFVTISPTTERELSSHEGEEFVIVQSGEVELQYGKETHALSVGDTMYYNSLVPHCLSAIGDEAQIYAVIFTL
ncbi:MAG: transcriptional regulator with XRE-family HTH domain [Desulforhopalus sp.]|jgi:transcriptional regulator with XRE-family HTH domain